MGRSHDPAALQDCYANAKSPLFSLFSSWKTFNLDFNGKNQFYIKEENDNYTIYFREVEWTICVGSKKCDVLEPWRMDDAGRPTLALSFGNRRDQIYLSVIDRERDGVLAYGLLHMI